MRLVNLSYSSRLLGCRLRGSKLGPPDGHSAAAGGGGEALLQLRPGHQTARRTVGPCLHTQNIFTPSHQNVLREVCCLPEKGNMGMAKLVLGNTSEGSDCLVLNPSFSGHLSSSLLSILNTTCYMLHTLFTDHCLYSPPASASSPVSACLVTADRLRGWVSRWPAFQV